MSARPITILSLVQVFLTLSIFLLVGLFMKLHGYPDARPWPFLPIFIREHALHLIMVTAIWTGLATYSTTRPNHLYRIVMIVGIGICVATVFFGLFGVFQAIIGPPLPLSAPK